MQIVTTSDPATGWFKIHQYDDNSPCQLQNYRTGFSTNYQNVYGIKLKPITVKNPQAKMLLWKFDKKDNYLDKVNPWKRIVSVTAAAIYTRPSTHYTGVISLWTWHMLNVTHEANWINWARTQRFIKRIIKQKCQTYSLHLWNRGKRFTHKKTKNEETKIILPKSLY